MAVPRDRPAVSAGPLGRFYPTDLHGRNCQRGRVPKPGFGDCYALRTDSNVNGDVYQSPVSGTATRFVQIRKVSSKPPPGARPRFWSLSLALRKCRTRRLRGHTDRELLLAFQFYLYCFVAGSRRKFNSLPMVLVVVMPRLNLHAALGITRCQKATVIFSFHSTICPSVQALLAVFDPYVVDWQVRDFVYHDAPESVLRSGSGRKQQGCGGWRWNVQLGRLKYPEPSVVLWDEANWKLAADKLEVTGVVSHRTSGTVHDTVTIQIEPETLDRLRLRVGDTTCESVLLKTGGDEEQHADRLPIDNDFRAQTPPYAFRNLTDTRVLNDHAFDFHTNWAEIVSRRPCDPVRSWWQVQDSRSACIEFCLPVQLGVEGNLTIGVYGSKDDRLSVNGSYRDLHSSGLTFSLIRVGLSGDYRDPESTDDKEDGHSVGSHHRSSPRLFGLSRRTSSKCTPRSLPSCALRVRRAWRGPSGRARGLT